MSGSKIIKEGLTFGRCSLLIPGRSEVLPPTKLMSQQDHFQKYKA